MKIRALILSVLMVLSVFGGTVALSGSAAAAAANQVDTSESFDGAVDSGATRWAGQDLFLEDSGNDSETFELHEVERDDNGKIVGDLVTEIPLDTNGEAVFSTGDADGGDYVVTNNNGQVVEFDSNGFFLSSSSPTNPTNVENADFAINDQTISTEFNESQVNNEGDDTARELEVDSNRGTYQLEVYASGLDQGDLAEIFYPYLVSQNELASSDDPSDLASDVGDDTTTVGTFTDDGTDKIRVPSSTDVDMVVNFSDIDASTYNFTAEVADTSDSSEASIQVLEQDSDREFSQSVINDQAGDIAEVTIDLASTDDAYVFIGSTETNMLERIELEDDNDDGQITFEINTRTAGTNDPDGDGTPSTNLEAAYDSEDDNVVDVTRPRTGTTSGYTTNSDVAPDGNTLDISDSLNNPMEDGEYNLIVSSSATVEVNDDDEVEIPDEDNTAVLSLNEGQIEAVNAWTAPENENIDELDEITEFATQTQTVAEDDQLIVQVQAGGIEGAVDDEEPGELQNNSGLHLIVRETNAGANQDPVVLDLDSGSAYELVEDADNDTYYLIVDTSDPDVIADEGSFDTGAYTIEFTETGADSDYLDDDLTTYYRESNTNQISSSPYLTGSDSDVIRQASTTFNLQDRSATFRGLTEEGSVLEVPQSSSATVSAQTNLAPQTEVTVRMSGEDSLYSQSVEVSSDRRIEATLDLSSTDIGQNLTGEIRIGGSALTTVDAVVVEEQTDTPTATDTPEPTDTPTDTATPEPTDTPTEMTETEMDTETSTETTSGDGPGFGAIVALVALLAAALLAVRRD